jgi:proteic killer suppression protein
MESARAYRRPQENVGLSVTRNWRLTFRIDAAEREIFDVNLEDYH